MRALMLAVLAVVAVSACSHSPTLVTATSVPTTPKPGSLAWQMSRPWEHVGTPVSDQQFAQDKNKCAVTANMAPVGQGTPELKFLVVFTQCMRGEGYQPVP